MRGFVKSGWNRKTRRSNPALLIALVTITAWTLYITRASFQSAADWVREADTHYNAQRYSESADAFDHLDDSLERGLRDPELLEMQRIDQAARRV
ncbi:hypothetical protein DRQ53_11060 [bacterium]|nr:MAG: hypothetical protein DRQ32_09700 [bacterium]RKZ14641.1 MAG: hypothetical protein DRQ53_11060 [bacterium]